MHKFVLPVKSPSVAGQTLVFFSDLHWNGARTDRTDQLVNAINAQRPEWILFGGDLIRYLSHLPAALDILAQLQARRGKIAVRGNRESVHTWRVPSFWHSQYAKAGFTCLVNETCIPAGDENPVFAGIDDPRYGEPDSDLCVPLLRVRHRILVMLSHSPDIVGALRNRYAGQFIMAGHTHGGQFRFPLVGAPFTSSAYGAQFDRGWFEREDGTRMFVTTGVGETGVGILRNRLNCPAEVAVIQFEHEGITSTLRTSPLKEFPI